MIQGSISVQTGLVSGIDTGSLIQQLMQVERRPIQVMQKRQSALYSQQSAIGTFQSKLEKLRDAAKEIDGLNKTMTGVSSDEEFIKYQGNSSDKNTLAVTAASDAQPGNYSVEVKQLAQSARIAHQGAAATDTSISAGDAIFALDIAGVEKTIDITGGQTTLNDLRDAINALGTEVKASIVNTGATVDPYRLVISGQNTGQDNTLDISASTTLAGFGDVEFEQVQSAKNSIITVDGIEIQRSGNSLSDVLEGVTIDLEQDTKNDAGLYDTVNVEIKLDEASMEGKIDNIVDAFNDVLSFAKLQSGNKQNLAGGPLKGDFMVLGVESKLRTMLGIPVDLGNGNSMSVHQLGIETTESGALKFDKEAFKEMLESDTSAVRSLFVSEGENNGLAANLSKYLEEIFAGGENIFDVRKDAIDDSVKSMDRQIESTERRLDKYESTLRKRFIAMEKALSSLQSNQDMLLQDLGSVNAMA